jgi:hypothetical protein
MKLNNLLLWELNCTLCIVKEDNYNIYLLNVDYKKIFNWIFNNFQKIKTWEKENVKEKLDVENVICINNNNFEKCMNFDNLKTYSDLNPMPSYHSDLNIIINIIENKMYLQGNDIKQFNYLNFEYLEAEDESEDAYIMDFNLEEISKLI